MPRPDGVSQLTELMRDEREYPRGGSAEPAAPVDPEERRRSRRRRITGGAMVAVVLLGAGGAYAGYTLNAPIGAAESTSQLPDLDLPPAARLVLSPDGSMAVSIAGADEFLGPTASGVFATSGSTKAVPIASLTKLITAMVILDAKPLAADAAGPTITFSRADHKLYDHYYVLGATIAAMETGSSMSERDALETMLIPSASNYADVLATWAFGSHSAFVGAARAWLVEHGLTSTTIVEPTGIDPRNTSTTADMIALGKLAAADPVISQIATMPTLDVVGMQPMGNTNTLLGSYGVTGLKTGTLKDSGSALLFTATVTIGSGSPVDVVGVELGGYSRESVNADVIALLTSITEGFHSVPLGEAGQPVGTYTTAWGDSARMVLGETSSIFTWSDTPVVGSIETIDLETGADGDEVGSITWTAGPLTTTVPIVLDGSITPPDAWWRLTHPTFP